ncbi:MAG: hypothetical protein ABI783_04265 [Actinomycetota bacterium]
MRKPLASRLVGFAVAVAVVGVGSATALARPAGPSAPPVVKIVSPARCPCGIVTPQSSTLTIVVAVKNLKLSAAHFGGQPVTGEGHLLFSLDHGKFDHPKFSGANGRLAAEIGVEGRYSPTVKNKITYKHIPDGVHTVVVYLAANNHKKLGPSASLTFTVQ